MHMIRDRPLITSCSIVEAFRAHILLENEALKFDLVSYCCLMALHYSEGLVNAISMFYGLKTPTINQAMFLHLHRTLGTSLTP